MGHTGERPYPCALCSESFIDSKALRRHREVAHAGVIGQEATATPGSSSLSAATASATTAPTNDLESVCDDDDDLETSGHSSMDHSGLSSAEDEAASGRSATTANSSGFESHDDDEAAPIKVEDDVDDEDRELEIEENSDDAEATDEKKDESTSSC